MRLVLVHGFTQTGRSWDRVAQRLTRAGGDRVLVPDLPGHGGAPVLPGGLAEVAAQLGEACGEATYVGYSMGARVCLRLALDRPQLVQRLVLVGATPGIADDGERDARRIADEALAERIGRLRIEDVVEEWLAGPLFSHLSAEQAGREARLASTPAGLAWALRTLGPGAEPSMWPRLSELSMPVLLVAGEHDAKFSALAWEIAEAIGDNAAVGEVPGAGHAAPFEQPSQFAQLVRGWLAES